MSGKNIPTELLELIEVILNTKELSFKKPKLIASILPLEYISTISFEKKSIIVNSPRSIP